MCQLTQQPILVSIIKTIKAMRAEGSMSPSELKRKVSMPKRTFYRGLKTLTESGVVINKDGKYYWYDFLDTRTYTSEFEANNALNHSENIASGLKHLIFHESTFIEGELVPDPEYTEYALIHLKIGYAEIHKIYEKAQKIRKQIDEKEKEFREKAKERLLASSLEVLYPDNVVEIIVSDIKEINRGRNPYFLNNLRIEGEQVKSGAYSSLVRPEIFEPFKHYIIEEETNSENKEMCGEIVLLESKHYELKKKFDDYVNNLIKQVENGTPLKGTCQLCPKIRISETTG